ncbi:hypothetical protein AALB16_12495 [Lachnospiraceae bacterium 62-35]
MWIYVKYYNRKKYASWGELEFEIQRIDATTVKGDSFEQFCYFYLKL